MSEQALDRGEADLHQLLTNPKASASALQRRLPRDLIWCFYAATESAQIVLIGSVVLLWLPGQSSAGPFWQAFKLCALVAALAMALRAEIEILRPKAADTAIPAAGRAALTAPIALTVVGTGYLVFDPDRSSDLLMSFLLWSTASGLASAGLRVSVMGLESFRGGERVVVACAPESVVWLSRLIAAWDRGWDVVGYADYRKPNELETLIDESDIDLVVLLPEGPNVTSGVAAVCKRLADRQVRLSLALDTAALTGGLRGSGSVGHVTLVDLWGCPHDMWRGVAKRAMDLIIGGLALFVFAPMMTAAALAIRLETPGAVLFRQWRFGAGSRPFRLLKFRTMYSDACDESGERRTAALDPRVSAVGRFLRRSSIDELPQLFNVLRGEMSLVGPRPHALHMRIGDAFYFEAVTRYRARHIVRPGITGWAQINGSRGEVDTLERARRRVELDLWYLEHWSLGLDLWILLRTALGGFASVGAD